MWLNVEEHPPPKDRLIEVTSGVAWRLEQQTVPPFTKTINELGSVSLVYWGKPPRWFYTTIAPEGWVVFGGGFVNQNFKFWRPFINPVKGGVDNYVFTEKVPDVETMPVYTPSEEEIKNKQKMKMLGF